MGEQIQKLIYLNNAATSFPKPEAVKDAIANAISKFASAERSTSSNLTEGSILLRGRNTIGKFFNVEDPKRVIFTQNCTEALNYAIKGILNEGDHVILDNTAHNSLARPLIALEKKGFITLSRLNPKNDWLFDLNEIKSLITSKTRLIAISHASNVTGVIQDIKSIGDIVKNTNSYFLVDAAQSAGQIPIDVQSMSIDFLATAGHKSLYGPTGTGVLYVSGKVKGLKTIKEGGTGSESESLDQPTNFPNMLESGTHNYHGISGLFAGVEFILKESLEKIREHEIKLTEELIKGLKKINGVKIHGNQNAKASSSVVSITVNNFDVADLGGILIDSFGIITRTGLHCAPLAHEFLGTLNTGGTLRISPGYFNAEGDIKKILSGLKEITT